MRQTLCTVKVIPAAVTFEPMRTHSLLTFWLRLAAVGLMLVGAHTARAADEFLEPEIAFKLAARAADERTVEVTVTAVSGYYLYREQFKFEAAGVTLGEPVMPQGKTDRKSTRLNSSHLRLSRMPSSA